MTPSFDLPPVTLGVMAFAPTEPTTRIATIDAAIDAGVTTLDTAPLYEFGESERIVGQAIRGKRDRVRVCTKVGLRWDGDHGDVLLRSEGRVVRKDSRPESVRRDVEASLARLGIECLDVCLVHHPDRHTPIGATMDALLQLQREGKLAAIGVSNFDAEQTRTAARELGSERLAVVQGGYNVLTRAVETTLLPTLAELKVGFCAYSPLAHGVLARTGTASVLSPQDWRQYDPMFHPVNRRAIDSAGATIQAIASDRNLTPAEVAMSWALGGRGVGGLVVGASRPQHVVGAVRAASVALTSHEREAIAVAFASVRIVEPRVRRRDRARGLARRVVGRVFGR